MPKLEAKDFIAAILLIGAFTLRALGINSLTEYLIVAIALVYLGIDRIPPRLKRGP